MTSYLLGAPDDRLQQLVDEGYLDPQTLAQLQAQRQTAQPPPPPAPPPLVDNEQARQAFAGGGPVSVAPPPQPPPRPPPAPPVQQRPEEPLRPQATPRQPPPEAPPPAYAPRSTDDMGRIQGRLEGAATNAARSAAAAIRATDKATAKQQEALDAEAELASQKAAERANLEQRAAIEQEARSKVFEEERAKRDAHMQGVAQELRTVEQEARDFKIDPDRKMSGVGNKIMAAVAAGLGAYAAAWTGGRNTGADLVRAAIEDDIAAQRAEIENKRDTVTSKSNELAQLHAQFGDWQRAEDALRVRRSEEAKARIDSVLSEYAGPEAKAAAEKQKAQLDIIKTEAAQRFMESADRQYVQSLAAAGNVAQDRAKIAAAGGGEDAAPAGLRLIPGQTPSKVRVDRAAQIKGMSDTLINAVKRLKAIREKAGPGGFEVMDRDLVAAGESALADAITAYKDSKELGALDRGSLELAERVLGGDPTGVGPRMARYDQLVNAIKQDVRSKIRPLGFEVDDPEDQARRLGGVPRGGG